VEEFPVAGGFRFDFKPADAAAVFEEEDAGQFRGGTEVDDEPGLSIGGFGLPAVADPVAVDSGFGGAEVGFRRG